MRCLTRVSYGDQDRNPNDCCSDEKNVAGNSDCWPIVDYFIACFIKKIVTGKCRSEKCCYTKSGLGCFGSCAPLVSVASKTFGSETNTKIALRANPINTAGIFLANMFRCMKGRNIPIDRYLVAVAIKEANDPKYVKGENWDCGEMLNVMSASTTKAKVSCSI